MKTIDSAIAAWYASGANVKYTVFTVTELIGPSTTYRYTNAPIPITWGGFTWTNLSFALSQMVIDADGEAACTITFEDASRTIRGIALANDLNQFQVKVKEVWANEANTLFGEDLIFYGSCDGVLCSGEDDPNPSATLALRGLFADSAQATGPTQNYTINCRYEQFKGLQCKYVGAAVSCDRLYATCAAMVRTDGTPQQINFGGFRFVLGEGERVQWGPLEGDGYGLRDVPFFTPPPGWSGETHVTDYGGGSYAEILAAWALGGK